MVFKIYKDNICDAYGVPISYNIGTPRDSEKLKSSWPQ